MMRITIFCALMLVAATTAKTICNGRLVRRTVNMEIDGDKKRLRKGSTVSSLPFLQVSAKRAHRSAVKATENDAAVTHFGEYGKVLAISADKSRPHRPNREGGVFTFTFKRKVHQLHRVEILRARKGTFLIRSGRRQAIKGRTTLTDWYDVRRFKLRYRNRALVAKIEYSICVPDKTPIKPDTLPNEMSLLKKKPSSIPISTSVTFECSFHNLWSLQRHPVRYPPDAHWSNPVLLTHPRSFKMWERGTLASPGTKILAELGNPLGVRNEAGIAGIEGMVIGKAQWNRSRQSQTVGKVIASAERPVLSTMTMIAPSPDWFTGTSSLELSDGKTWYAEVSVETMPYDAGTDSGPTFTSFNEKSIPFVPVFRMDKGIFVNPKTRIALPVARWECTLQES